MKSTLSLICGLLLAAAGTSTMAAQTNYDAWVTTEGAGIVLHGGQSAPTRTVVHHVYDFEEPCPHHHHRHCKVCQKAYKQHKKQMKKAHKQAHKQYKKARKEIHHHRK